MAVGELTQEEQSIINTAVGQAELDTGVEFCVLFSSTTAADLREEAERFFHKTGHAARPSVLIMIVPHARRIELLTAHDLRDRISDEDAEEAVRLMSGMFSLGDIVPGLQKGIEFLVEQAGVVHDRAHQDGDLPNVINLDDEQ